jgi:hypothetical protein
MLERQTDVTCLRCASNGGNIEWKNSGNVVFILNVLSTALAGVLDEPYSQLTPISGLAVHARHGSWKRVHPL